MQVLNNNILVCGPFLSTFVLLPFLLKINITIIGKVSVTIPSMTCFQRGKRKRKILDPNMWGYYHHLPNHSSRVDEKKKSPYL